MSRLYSPLGGIRDEDIFLSQVSYIYANKQPDNMGGFHVA